MWPLPRSLLHLKTKELGETAVTMEAEAVETPEILYHLHICTGVAVMVELVEVHTQILVGSQLPQVHMVLRLSLMDLPLLNHTDLRRLIPMVPHPKHMDHPLLSHMDLPRLISMVPHPKLTELPLLNHMDLPHPNHLVLRLLKVMGLQNRNQSMDLLVAPTDRRNLAVGEEKITLKWSTLHLHRILRSLCHCHHMGLLVVAEV
jgi:hypothetical protein